MVQIKLRFDVEREQEPTKKMLPAGFAPQMDHGVLSFTVTRKEADGVEYEPARAIFTRVSLTGA